MIQIETATTRSPKPTPPETMQAKKTRRGTTGVKSRMWYAWVNGKKTARLTEQQTKELDKLYQPREQYDVNNVSSLAAALNRCKELLVVLNEDAIDDAIEADHVAGDCQCSIQNLSNAPVLYRQCEQVDAF